MVRRRFSAPPARDGQPTIVDYVVARDLEPNFWIGFVGDISPLGRRTAVFDPAVIAFFSGCKYLVGNLEGVITTRGPLPYRHNHSPGILEALSAVRPLPAWSLSLANNHAGDYGDIALARTIDHLDGMGVGCFGTKMRPHLELGSRLTVTAWTQWLNRPTTQVPRRDPGAPAWKGLHFAYPHWGFEHERLPRASQRVPAGYQLVVGHHSHLPQPFTCSEDGVLVAWSLGNFLTAKRLPVLGEGAVLKVGITEGAGRVPQVVVARYQLIKLDRSDGRYCRVVPYE